MEAEEIKQELIEMLKKEVSDLPELCRMVYLKAYVEGKNVFEIAGDLSITVDSSRVQLAKALRLLKSPVLKVGINTGIDMEKQRRIIMDGDKGIES